MTDLRAAVEGLPDSRHPRYDGQQAGPRQVGTVSRAAVLALIPEGAVLVTEAHEPEIHGHCDTEIVLGCLCGWRQHDGPWMDHLRETP